MKLVGALGLLAIGVIYRGCGPGTPPMNGSVDYSWGCRLDATHPMCAGGTVVYQGAPSMDTSVMLSCSISTDDNNRPAQIRFLIARGGTTFAYSTGIALCGTVNGTTGALTGGSVDINSPSSVVTNARL